MRSTALPLVLVAWVAWASDGSPSVHEATVAGSFYPQDPKELRQTVHRLVAASPKVAEAKVKAVLAPHAGYTYTSKVLAAAYRQLEPNFQRVVIVAGNHSDARLEGASVDGVSAYRVPGLEVKVSPAARALAKQRLFVDAPAVHQLYMIEVELPYLAEVNQAPFELVPIIVGRLGPKDAQQLARSLHALADGKTRFVFSVDLSHYHSYDEAVALDSSCLASLEAMDLDRVARCDTDATQVLRVMTELAALEGWTPRLIASANSGDVPDGDRSRVVGYGAIAYEDRLRLTPGEGAALVELARGAVEAMARKGSVPAAPPELVARLPRLALPRATFVTLEQKDQLRGCVGTIEPDQPLAESVIANAVHAARDDWRFSPVRETELSQLRYTVSVLDAPRPVDAHGEALFAALKAHPGVVLRYQGRHALFLPEVWDDLPEPGRFLSQLCAKLGAENDCWRSPKAQLEQFTTQRFSGSAAR